MPPIDDVGSCLAIDHVVASGSGDAVCRSRAGDHPWNVRVGRSFSAHSFIDTDA